MAQKQCPDCDQPAAYLAECPQCGADLRARCGECSLPFSGEGDLCRCGTFTEEEAAEFYRTAPPKSANRNNGGKGHIWLRNRRRNKAAA